MKKQLLKFAAVLAVFGAALLYACEVEPPTPDCEKYGYGEVTVKNSTGYQIKVDVTYASNDVNYEKWLNNGSTYTYKMDKGTVYIWASFDGDDWVYDTYYLDACEDLSYTWYLNKKKSANGCPFVLDIGNGQLVEPKIAIKNKQ